METRDMEIEGVLEMFMQGTLRAIEAMDVNAHDTMNTQYQLGYQQCLKDVKEIIESEIKNR